MSAICVQNFDDSLSPAIHTRYRISLRSSSLREPRYPLLRVVYGFHSGQGALALSRIQMYCSVCENELMRVECWKPTRPPCHPPPPCEVWRMNTGNVSRPQALAYAGNRRSLAPTSRTPARLTARNPQENTRGTSHHDKDSQRWIWIGCQ